MVQDASSLYWVTAEPTLLTCPKSGCGQAPQTVYSDPNGATNLSTDGSDLYWVDQYSGGLVQSCPVSGCSQAHQIAAYQTASEIAAGTYFAFWDTYTSGDLRECPKASSCSGSSTLVLSGEHPLDLLADGKYVFWGRYDGVVRRCLESSCAATATDLATGQGTVREVAQDANNVYWVAQSGDVMACSKTGCGGAPNTLAAKTVASNLASDGSCVYWTTDNGVMTVAVP